MIYTIGHSTLEEKAFLKLVEPVDIIIDIRSHPGSKWPQYHKEKLEKWIPAANKSYEWEPRLGGWTSKHLPLQSQFTQYNIDITPYSRNKFPKQRIAMEKKKHSDQPTWHNQGLYDYSFFMMLDEFLEGANELIQRGIKENVGIMCAEILPWKCHRSMVSDYIVWRGQDTIHLQPKLKSHSDMINNRLQRYHSDILTKWKNGI